MTKLTKTTTNKATRNGLAITFYTVTDRIGNKYETIEIAEWDAEEEEAADFFIAAYRVNSDGSFTYDSTCKDGKYDRCNDFPARIRDEQHLRDLLPEFAAVA